MSKQPFYHQAGLSDADPHARYLEHPVHEALRPFVATMWSFDSRAPHNRLIIPDGCSNVMFGFCETSGERMLGIGTPLSHPMVSCQEGGVRWVGVRFRWGAASAFWNLPPLSGKREFLQLEDFLPAYLHGSADRLADAGTQSARLMLLQELLLSVAPNPSVLDDNIEHAVCGIQKSVGRVRAEELADLVGYSASQLRRRLIAKIGLGPKQLLRICRIWNSMGLACRQGRPNWGSIAAQLDYYDQAHLIRDFKSLVGLTPSAWLANVRR